MLTPEQYHEIMDKDRAGILTLIGESRYITLLPPEKQGRYLIGTAKNDRAVCLAWGNDTQGQVTMDMMEQAYTEIAHAGLAIPFLFFCKTCLVVAPHLFECMQIPYVFEDNTILPTLRTLNLRGRPHQARRIA
jgi:hypothetical protein